MKLRLAKVGWATGGSAFTLIYGVVSHALLSRMLSPSEYGAYLLLVSIVLGATVLGLFGSTKLTVRLIAEDLGRGRKRCAADIVKRAIASVAVRGGAAGVFAFSVVSIAWKIGLASDFRALSTGLAVFLLLWIPSAALNSMATEIHRAYHDIRGASIFASLPGLLNMIGLLLLLLLDIRSIQAAILCMSAAVFIAMLLGNASLFRLVTQSLRSVDSSDSLEETGKEGGQPLVSFSVLVSDVFYYAIGNLGIWLLAYLSDPQSVALYGVAVRLAALVSVPLMIANLILPPIIAQKASQRQNQELESTLRTSATLTTLPALVACLICIGFGQTVLSYTFGTFYVSSYLLLVVLSIGHMADVALGSGAMALVMSGNQRLSMVVSAVSSLVVCFISLVFVIQYGAIGMAIAASIGLVIQKVSCVVAVRLRLGIWTHILLPFRISKLARLGREMN